MTSRLLPIALGIVLVVTVLLPAPAAACGTIYRWSLVYWSGGGKGSNGVTPKQALANMEMCQASYKGARSDRIMFLVARHALYNMKLLDKRYGGAPTRELLRKLYRRYDCLPGAKHRDGYGFVLVNLGYPCGR